MKRFKKIIAMGLSVTAAVSAIGLSVYADDPENEIVYSYIDDNGNEAAITQAELDDGYWDTEKLNGQLPIVYENFPASINNNVGEFSDLTVKVKYMKSGVDYANLSVYDLYNNETVLSSSLMNGVVETPELDLNGAYLFTIVESIDGVEHTYDKTVKTIKDTAEMPDYVTDHSTDSEQIVLVGDVDDLRASEVDDGEGNIEIIAGAKRFDRVMACDLGEYISDMDEDTIYKIYTADDSGNTYLGYMDTSDSEEKIYMPSIEVHSGNILNTPQLCQENLNVTESMIMNANYTNISQQKDYSFTVSGSSSNSYKVYRYEIPEIDDGGSTHFAFKLNASTSTHMQVWLQSSSSSIPVKKSTEHYYSGTTDQEMILAAFNAQSAEMGDYLYFVFYCSGSYTEYGYFSFMLDEHEYDDDVCGSVYEVYSEKPSTSVLNMDEIMYEYSTTDYRDVDAFYLNYSGSSLRNIKFTLNNNKETNANNKRTKHLGIYTVVPREDELPSIGLMDYYEVQTGRSKSYTASVSYSEQYVMTVSDVPVSSANKTVSFNDLNDIGIQPCTYAVWSGYRD